MKKYLAISIMLLALVPGTCHSAPPRVAFVGDSLTRGTGSTGLHGYAGYYADATGGETTRFVRYHLADAIVLWDEVEAWEPDVVVLELGIHAIVGCDHLATQPDTFRRYYAMLLDLATATAPEVVVVDIPWMAWSAARAETAQRYNAIIQEEADERGATVVRTFNATEACGDGCLSGDGFHPNDAGHRMITDEILRQSVRWLFMPVALKGRAR